MTDYVFNPANLALADGTALANGAVSGGAAGWQHTWVTSSGGTVTAQSGAIEFSGNAGTARADATFTAATTWGEEILFDCRALPTGAANRFYELLTATATILRLEMNTSGTVVLLNSSNASVWTSGALTTGEFRMFVGVTMDDADGDTNGEILVNLYTTNPRTSTTPDFTFTSAAFSTGSNTTATRSRKGRLSSTAGSTALIRVLYAQGRDTNDDPIGPIVSAPTLVGDPVHTFNRVIDFTSAVAGATSLSFVSQTAGPSVGTVTVTGMKASYVENTLREDDVTLNFSAIGPGGSLAIAVTIEPEPGPITEVEVIRRVGTLVMIGGVIK